MIENITVRSPLRSCHFRQMSRRRGEIPLVGDQCESAFEDQGKSD